MVAHMPGKTQKMHVERVTDCALKEPARLNLDLFGHPALRTRNLGAEVPAREIIRALNGVWILIGADKLKPGMRSQLLIEQVQAMVR